MDPVDALYARQSVDKKDSISIESQIEFCKYETRGNPYEIYTDRGFSGKNINRPDFERMMTDVKSGKIRRVIVYKLDRISRSILDFSNMMEAFQQYHVEFVSSTEKFDTSTPIGRAMLNICIVFAQLERETIQKRVTDAYYARSQKGFYMGGRIPYGFKIEKCMVNGIHTSRFIPDEKESGTIKLIYGLYEDADATLGDVMRELVNRRIEKRGASWCTARISEIIRNPVYVKADVDIYNFFKSQGSNLINPVSDFIGENGLFLYKGMDGDQKKRKQYDLENREVVIAPHQGLIESGQWLKCRMKLMKNRQLARTKKGKRTWLTGKIKCAKCGYAYVTTTSNNPLRKRYFQCSGARYAIKCKGTGHTIYADVFEEYILEEMKKVMARFQYLTDASAVAAENPREKYKIRIAELEKEIEALLAKVSDAGDVLMGYINKRIAALDGEKKQCQEKMLSLTVVPAKEMDKITDFIQMWDRISMEDKQQIADILIHVILISEDTISIEWNL